MGDKAHEIRMRNWSKRLGLRLHKSKKQKWSVDDHRGYQLLNQDVIILGEKFELTLDEVEKYLLQYENKLKQ